VIYRGLSMGLIKTIVGILFIFFSISAYSIQPEYYAIKKTQGKNTVILHALPSEKSKVIAHIIPLSKNILFLGKRKQVDRNSWMKVRWNKKEGWINSRLLIKQSVKQQRKENNLSLQSQRKGRIEKKLSPKALSKDKSFPTILNIESKKDFLQGYREELDDRYLQYDDISPIKKMGRTLFSIQRKARSRLRCKGPKSNKWKINMNMLTKRMWVNLEGESSYSIPITYSQWKRKGHKRMLVKAGKGRKRVKAVLYRNNRCRRGFSLSRYAYSIKAEAYPAKVLYGCCAHSNR